MTEGRSINIDGELLADSLHPSITVVQELNQHWWCEIDFRLPADQRFPAEDKLGKDLNVTVTGEDGAEVSIFDGFILESEIEYEASGSYKVRFLGVSRSYLMDLTPRRQYYYQQSPADVATRLLSATGLALEGAVEGPQLSYVQIAETDFHYLLRLVDESEKWLRPAEDGVEVQGSFQPGVTLEWRGEHGLLHFSIAGNISQPSATGAHYDYRKMQSEVAQKIKDDPEFYGSSDPMVKAVKTSSASLPAEFPASRERLLDVAGLQDRLKKETRRSQGRSVTCHGISRERALLAGNEVRIQGMPDANGTYGVVRVIHRWSNKGYENEFLCTPWKKYTSPNPPHAPRFEGVVPARVLDNNDPQGLGRLQVQYFWQEDSHTCWLRLMTPHSGADRGFMFLPEIGDEVWVMFEEGDPERARVLGSSWNGVLHPPREQFWGDDVAPNDVKRIVTKSGHRITIVDKQGKNSIVVATPKHLKISLIENGDETKDAMLTLHSDGDIVLSAPNGRIHTHSKLFSREIGSPLQLEVSQDIEPDAVHIAPNQPHSVRSKQISDAVSYAWNHAEKKSEGNCAAYVAEAIRKGGGIPIKHISEGSEHSRAAKDMGWTLKDAGFTPAKTNLPPYQPGDVAVIDACPPKHSDGHAAMWTGKEWVSDYRQGGYLQPELPYPRQEYRDAKTPFAVYHWPASNK